MCINYSIIGDSADEISFEESGKYIVRNGIVFSVSKLKAALHALLINCGKYIVRNGIVFNVSKLKAALHALLIN